MRKILHRPTNQNGSTIITFSISVAIFLVFMLIAYSFLPKEFSNDLSSIGRGENVVLLVHDHDSVQSLKLMDFIGAVRSDYWGEIAFIVADDTSIEGRAFIKKQQVHSGDLLFFGKRGDRIRVVQDIRSERALRRLLDGTFE